MTTPGSPELAARIDEIVAEYWADAESENKDAALRRLAKAFARTEAALDRPDVAHCDEHDQALEQEQARHAETYDAYNRAISELVGLRRAAEWLVKVHADDATIPRGSALWEDLQALKSALARALDRPDVGLRELHQNLEAFADDMDTDGHGHLARRLRAIWRKFAAADNQNPEPARDELLANDLARRITSAAITFVEATPHPDPLNETAAEAWDYLRHLIPEWHEVDERLWDAAAATIPAEYRRQRP